VQEFGGISKHKGNTQVTYLEIITSQACSYRTVGMYTELIAGMPVC